MPHWRPIATNSPLTCVLANAPQIVGAVAGAVAAIALMPVLAPAFLGILGFGAAGPVAGKSLPQSEVALASNRLKLLGGIAAGIQAGIGNVAAGGLFAVVQGIAIGAAIPVPVMAVVGGVGAGVGAAAAGAGPDDEDNGEGEEDPADDDAD